MPESEPVDVVVIGMGPGGEDVAGKLAEAGLSVVGVEAELVGGECPYWGCVPSKMMIRAGNVLAEGRRIPELSGTSMVSPDFSPVAKRIREEATDNWDDQVAVDRFVGKGGRLVRGHGRLDGPGNVVVTLNDGSGEQRFTAAKAVVIGTGTKPSTPPVDGLKGIPFWTNRDAVSATAAPESLLVLGGGAIGVELAQMFARFGTKVTIVEVADRVVAAEEPESGHLLREILEREGLTVITGAKVSAARHEGNAFTLTVNGDVLSAEQLLVAAGRRADLSALGLETVDGFDPDARWIEVDDRMRAGHKLWAVGDVTGKGAFTHMAMYQSGIAVNDILGRDGEAATYNAIPRVTFTDPEIGAVGMTEKQARDAGLNVRTGTGQVPSSTRGWIHEAGNEGFIKLIEDADTGKLVGATSMGPVGGEVLSALCVAIHGDVATDQLRSMIYAYPTFHRGIEDALRDLS